VTSPDATQALREELARVRRERDAALQALRQRTRFFVAASHDLRQPLHAMRMFTQALDPAQPPAQSQGALRLMGEALDALEDMFDDLLDFSRLNDRGIAPQMQPVRLQPLFDRVARQVRAQAFDKGLDLRWRGGHRVVRADPLLLERVLRNLVSNALRYTDDGGVLVACRPCDGGFRLQVWDSGVGFDPAALFTAPAVVADHPLPRHRVLGAGGWGLGLAIVRWLADAQGLPLQVRSVPGRGSVFSLGLRHSGETGPPSGASSP
jgi:signal transduction histidine kinase